MRSIIYYLMTNLGKFMVVLGPLGERRIGAESGIGAKGDAQPHVVETHCLLFNSTVNQHASASVLGVWARGGSTMLGAGRLGGWTNLGNYLVICSPLDSCVACAK